MIDPCDIIEGAARDVRLGRAGTTVEDEEAYQRGLRAKNTPPQPQSPAPSDVLRRELRVEVNLSALARLQDLVDRAWGIIANANGGNWGAPTIFGSKLDAEWKAAAEKWRDDFHGGPPG